MLFQYNHPNFIFQCSVHTISFNIDCDNIMNCLGSYEDQFLSYYQKILVLKYLQKHFGEMYLGGKNNIVRDDLFIVKNIKIYNNMYASEFKGLIYKYFQKHL